MEPKELDYIIERQKAEIIKASEFLLMPHLKEWVIVGNLEQDACFEITSGEIGKRFSFNFAGYGLYAAHFSSYDHAMHIIENNNLRSRFPTVVAMDRIKYIEGWIQRAKVMLKTFEDIRKDIK